MKLFWVEGLYVPKGEGGRKAGPASRPFTQSFWADSALDAIQLAVQSIPGARWIEGPVIAEKSEQKLRSLAQTDPNALYYIRATLANAADVQVDRQGRIMVPANLIKLVGLIKEVLIIGALERMEIWDPEAFEKYLEDCPESYEEVSRKILI